MLVSLIVAVMAGVVCHYIIKWLDGDKSSKIFSNIICGGTYSRDS